jgi:hypothetical protein
LIEEGRSIYDIDVRNHTRGIESDFLAAEYDELLNAGFEPRLIGEVNVGGEMLPLLEWVRP